MHLLDAWLWALSESAILACPYFLSFQWSSNPRSIAIRQGMGLVFLVTMSVLSFACHHACSAHALSGPCAPPPFPSVRPLMVYGFAPCFLWIPSAPGQRFVTCRFPPLSVVFGPPKVTHVSCPWGPFWLTQRVERRSVPSPS